MPSDFPSFAQRHTSSKSTTSYENGDSLRRHFEPVLAVCHDAISLEVNQRRIRPELEETAHLLSRSFFADDLLTGTEMGAEALQLYKEANDIIHAGDMLLEK